MYAALDLGQRTIRAVLKRQDGKIVNKLKIKRQADSVLKFLKGTNVVMESGYNYQHLYDLLKSKGYNVKVAHPLMVKAELKIDVKEFSRLGVNAAKTFEQTAKATANVTKQYGW